MENEKRTLEELRQAAIEMLEEDDDLFVECINELDNWNGFADGYRCYPMYEFNDLFCGVEPLDVIDKISTSAFSTNDNYFVETIYGIESTDFPEDVYRDNTDEKEVLDNVIDYYNHLSISDSEFNDLVEEIINYEEDEDEDEDEEDNEQ